MPRQDWSLKLISRSRKCGDNGKAAIPFTTDPFRRHCLLNGLDDIGLTFQKVEAVEKFELRRSELWPWLDGFGYKGKKIPLRGTGKMEW